MANRERGERVLAIGDQSFTLRVTTNACVEVEELSGRTWDQITGGLQAGSLRDARLLLWACLRDHHPTVATCDKEGLARIGELIDRMGGVLHDGLEPLAAFLRFNAEPALEEAGHGRPLKAQDVPTGAGSTPTPSSSA